MSRRLEAFQQMLDRARGARGLALMGICNVTPDSFSDGGKYFQIDAARSRIDELIHEGADIVDVGGESTRPGAASVPAEEQIRRVIDAVRYATSRGALVSIDTTDPAVAAACLDAGACAVNDVSLLKNTELADVAANAEATLVLMHARGTPEAMPGFSQTRSSYGDIVREVCAEWEHAAARARSRGVSARALVMDPGLGFAKNADHSMELVTRLPEIVRAVGVPVLLGASRKSFLTAVEPNAAPMERLGASIAVALYAARVGVSMLRVHDVRVTRQAVDCARRIGGG